MYSNASKFIDHPILSSKTVRKRSSRIRPVLGLSGSLTWASPLCWQFVTIRDVHVMFTFAMAETRQDPRQCSHRFGQSWQGVLCGQRLCCFMHYLLQSLHVNLNRVPHADQSQFTKQNSWNRTKLRQNPEDFHKLQLHWSLERQRFVATHLQHPSTRTPPVLLKDFFLNNKPFVSICTSVNGSTTRETGSSGKRIWTNLIFSVCVCVCVRNDIYNEGLHSNVIMQNHGFLSIFSEKCSNNSQVFVPNPNPLNVPSLDPFSGPFSGI